MTSRQAYELAVAFNQLAVKLQVEQNTIALSLDSLARAQYYNDIAIIAFSLEMIENPLEAEMTKRIQTTLMGTFLTIDENIAFFQAKKA